MDERIVSNEPYIEIPSSKILCSDPIFVSPSEIAFNRSDSLTLNSDAVVIFVFPNANDAAMLRIGISSIIFLI